MYKEAKGIPSNDSDIIEKLLYNEKKQKDTSTRDMRTNKRTPPKELTFDYHLSPSSCR